MSQTIPIGHEAPQQGCLYDNGYNICPYGEANLRDAYLEHRELLGPPLSSFDSRSQVFLFGKLVYTPGNSEKWKVELSNEGLSHLIRNGYGPQPGSQMHPAVSDYLRAQQEVGVDTVRTSGRIISPALRDPVTGLCRQWADKAVYQFPCDAESGTMVQRLALGLESIPAPLPIATAVTVVAEPAPAYPFELASSAIVLAIAAVVLLTRLTRRRPSGLTN